MKQKKRERKMKEHEVSHKDNKESKEREKLKRPDMKAKN